MRALRIAACIVLTATAAFAQSGAQRSFDQLKSLAGSWEGKNSMGQPVQVSYRMTAGGSALMSEIVGHGETMISMINFDGPNRLLLTHYCAVGKSAAHASQRFAGWQDHHFQLCRCHQSRQSAVGAHGSRSDRHARTRPPHRGVELQRSWQGDQGILRPDAQELKRV